MPVGSISNLDLTMQTSVPGGNDDSKPNEARAEWSLAISQVDNRQSALSQKQKRETQGVKDKDGIAKSPTKTFKRTNTANTDKPPSNQLGMPPSEKPDSKFDRLSQKKHPTTLSFPSDFSKRAREIKNKVRHSPQKRTRLSNSRSR